MKPDMFMVLAALAAGEADAVEILRRLRAARAGATPTVPTLYRRLADAEESGWIEVVRPEVETGRGRPPQLYRLTGAGRRVARAEAKRWAAIAALVPDANRP